MSKNMQQDDMPPPFSRVYDVTEVSGAGASGSMDLDSSERKSIAILLQILEVRKFAFEYRLIPQQRKRFSLEGQLNVIAVQECVVTLEPVESIIDQKIQIDLWPPKDVEMAEKLAEEEGRTIILDGPEPIIDGQIDVGQLAYEHFADTLDPFPRKAGIEFKWSDTDAAKSDIQRSKPFANLNELLLARETRSEKS